MKKYYEPEFNIVKFLTIDVLASSTPTSKPDPVVLDENGEPWTPFIP